MTPRNPVDPDAITRAEAAALLGISKDCVSRLRHEGLIGTREGLPSYSRTEILAYLNNPWLTGVQAAEILGVGHTRVTQLANADRIPVHRTASGQRVYRRTQIEVVANARHVRYLKFRSSTGSSPLMDARTVIADTKFSDNQ